MIIFKIFIVLPPLFNFYVRRITLLLLSFQVFPVCLPLVYDHRIQHKHIYVKYRNHLVNNIFFVWHRQGRTRVCPLFRFYAIIYLISFMNPRSMYRFTRKERSGLRVSALQEFKEVFYEKD